MRPSPILYAVVLLATPAFTLPLVLVTPAGGPASEDTVRPLSRLTGKKLLNDNVSENTARPVSGLSGKIFSEHASETPENSHPPKMGLDQLEMDLEMNP